MGSLPHFSPTPPTQDGAWVPVRMIVLLCSMYSSIAVRPSSRPMPGGAVAAERDLWEAVHVAVDPDGSSLGGARISQCSINIAAPDARHSGHTRWRW